MIIKETLTDRIFNFINILLMVLITIIILYPLYFIVIASISDPVMVNSGQVMFWPKGITINGYQRVIADVNIWIGYRNSIGYTVVGTILNLLLTIPCAYALSRKDMIGRNFIMGFFTLTMFFGGGLIPYYLVVKGLGLVNTFWALIIPGSISVYNLIVSRTYMQRNIPIELQEAAIIDGCSNTHLFTGIILPLSTPIIAVMSLFYGVGHWNSYFNALIFISNKNLKPLQIILRDILMLSQSLLPESSDSVETMAHQAKIAELIKYSVIIVSSVPVLIAYPFIQKYFTQGIMLGAIKG